MSERVLVAGIGNVFFGDDGFGVEVARRLGAEPQPDGVVVADYGIRGLHLAYRLLEPLDLLVAVDAAPRGGAPGTLYVIEPDVTVEPDDAPTDAHGMCLPAVLASARMMGGALPRVVVVGCEPAEIVERIGLSPTVGAAVEPALELVRAIAYRELTTAAAEVAREAVP
ncbi:MAG TPA: hydrogenase maturation protease [Anaeromyxobacteraceae bacterium]|nr:hydrogenase maturation protease [Anaeromyxobacteraceae bacterium]